MSKRKAKDLMVPLDEYPTVDSSATVLDAVMTLSEFRQAMPSGRHPYQAVLVVNKDGNVVGKLGQFALLKALEPRSHVVDDLAALTRAGVSDNILETVLDHFRVFQHELSEMCISAAALPVKNVMRPIVEHVNEDTPICDVIHQMVIWQTLSILVTREGKPIGLVRLVDLCDEVMKEMRQIFAKTDSRE